ncbi:phosphoenolpyruvate-protein phosphotransferase [Thiorhodococcus drewsii AZ1]|uniref:Phosphoenolpyruvate-protein phosphotransferase n=1 Tax=Thiorhodococcus drewsii AZ1 TaxID=765913 RepID=G2E253_9GAMM|nr:phosphoenolpyruvate--protein phosphotransferase [Thiorhodococcus drewsii]EGV31002.1 phosphoenolpyruvate-protein phosphotransferase [Thiorhodococcus drewsii AZ1]
MTIAFQGIGIASACSIALGPAFIDARDQHTAAHRAIAADQVEAELTRFDQALDAARQALRMVRDQISTDSRIHAAEFLDAHLLMLDDPMMTGAIQHIVQSQLCCAEWALQIHCERLMQVFDEMDDTYLRARGDDVQHLVRQIQGFLREDAAPPVLADQDLIGHIVVARDLTPADAILLHQRGAAAFVTEYGGPTSHTAILARSLGIPAIVGIHEATRYLRPNEFLIVDGETGTLLASSDDNTRQHFRQRLRAIEQRQRQLRDLVDLPSRTRDGVPIKIMANLELSEDVQVARAAGADGVGLYRTEFLYMNRDDLPDEEEHLANYIEILEGLDGIPLTIRTLDLGVDKRTDAMPGPSDNATNPALGLRAIRLCLKELELFRPQLRAILRASALGPVRLMLPLVTNLHEVDTVLDLIGQIKRELDADGLDYDPRMRIGAMIEVPGAALAARPIARRLDFLSIGTNDLIQYTLAIDRLDDAVNYLFDPTHPAILRLIRIIIEAGAAEGVPVSMCGEMASDPRFTRLLLGMGLREFSMQPGAILNIKETVLNADTQKLNARAEFLFTRLDDADPSLLLDALNAD